MNDEDVLYSEEIWELYINQYDMDSYMKIWKDFLQGNDPFGGNWKGTKTEGKKVDVVSFSDPFDFFHTFFTRKHEAERVQLLDDVAKNLDIGKATSFWEKQYSMIEDMIDEGKTFEEIKNRILLIANITNLKRNYK